MPGDENGRPLRPPKQLLSFLFLFIHRACFGLGVMMKAAVKKGDAKMLAELIRQDPGFDVN